VPAGPSTVGGGVAIDLGSGREQSAVVNNLSVTGALRITAKSEPSLTDLTGIHLYQNRVERETTITGGVGADHVTVNRCTFVGSFALATGGGNDTVEIEQALGPAATLFNGGVSVRTGNGRDTIRVGRQDPGAGSPISQAVCETISQWFGGLGKDTIQILALNEFNGPEPEIVGFETES
jgi:hypothetical protein